MNAGARLEGTWEAMAGVMDVLRADLVCTPGLRFPAVFARDSPVPSSAEGLPEAYGYLYAGFRRATYDGVGWLHRPGRTVALAPDTEERIVVVEAGGGAFVGTYVEHLGHTEAAWAARLKRVAAVANQLVKRMGSSRRYIWICGDLNTREPAHQQTAMTILAAAGFFPDGGPSATHRSGHRLDWVFSYRGTGAAPGPRSGVRLSGAGYAVSDHAALTWSARGTTGGDEEERRCTRRVVWTGSVEAWQAALVSGSPRRGGGSSLHRHRHGGGAPGCQRDGAEMGLQRGRVVGGCNRGGCRPYRRPGPRRRCPWGQTAILARETT